jgi:hypothetical protein
MGQNRRIRRGLSKPGMKKPRQSSYAMPADDREELARDLSEVRLPARPTIRMRPIAATITRSRSGTRPSCTSRRSCMPATASARRARCLPPRKSAARAGAIHSGRASGARALAAELSGKLSCRSANGQGLARGCHHRSRLVPGRLWGDGDRRRRALRNPLCPPAAGSRSTPLSKAPPAIAAQSRPGALSSPIVAVRVPRHTE